MARLPNLISWKEGPIAQLPPTFYQDTFHVRTKSAARIDWGWPGRHRQLIITRRLETPPPARAEKAGPE